MLEPQPLALGRRRGQKVNSGVSRCGVSRCRGRRRVGVGDTDTWGGWPRQGGQPGRGASWQSGEGVRSSRTSRGRLCV